MKTRSNTNLMLFSAVLPCLFLSGCPIRYEAVSSFYEENGFPSFAESVESFPYEAPENKQERILAGFGRLQFGMS